MKKSFTLIERERPEKASESSPVKSPESANCSFHAYSLTAGECGDARTGCAVTKPREGKPAVQGGLRPAPKALTGNGEEQIAGRLTKEEQGTRNQSGRQGKNTGRRQTNDCKHRKSNPAGITGRAGNFGKGRPSVRCGKSAIIREENGQEHLMARRCKRRRHVWKDSLSSWREPVWSRQRVSESIRRNAESWNNAVQGVGDGRSSENGKDNITLPMQRAISLRTCPKMKRPADDCPKGSTHPTKSRARINQGTLYPTANANGTENDVCRMRKDESQGESRTWENCISGSVCGVKAIPLVRSAFTLVELMLVITIIAILVTMLLPGISKIREKGKTIKCVSNLKQIFVNVSFYSNDYRVERIPDTNATWTIGDGGWWHSTLDKCGYIKLSKTAEPTNIMKCDSASPSENVDAFRKTHYGINITMTYNASALSSKWLPTERIRGENLSKTMYFSDKHACDSVATAGTATDTTRWWRHGGNRSYVMLDGHGGSGNIRKVPSMQIYGGNTMRYYFWRENYGYTSWYDSN